MLGLLNLKIVFKDEYEKLVEEWEVQNRSIDIQAALLNKQDKIINEFKKEQAELEQLIKNVKENHAKSVKKYEGEKAYLQIQLEEAKAKYEEVEKLRRSYAGKNGGYVKQIHKLEAQINDLEGQVKKLEETNEFLKKHRRAPNIEEIKDYELRRLRNKKAS